MNFGFSDHNFHWHATYNLELIKDQTLTGTLAYYKNSLLVQWQKSGKPTFP